MDDLDQRIDAVDDAENVVGLEITDPTELDKDTEAADAFCQDVRTERVHAAKKLKETSFEAPVVHGIAPTSPSVHRSSSGGSVSCHVRLPVIELQKFDDDVMQWQTFWDQLVVMVDQTETPTIFKFCYLNSLLEGEAKAVLQDLTLTAAKSKLHAHF